MLYQCGEISLLKAYVDILVLILLFLNFIISVPHERPARTAHIMTLVSSGCTCSRHCCHVVDVVHVLKPLQMSFPIFVMTPCYLVIHLLAKIDYTYTIHLII